MYRRIISTLCLVMGFSKSLADSPSLVVIVAADQMKPDRMSREMPGGLGRLMREGHVFI